MNQTQRPRLTVPVMPVSDAESPFDKPLAGIDGPSDAEIIAALTDRVDDIEAVIREFLGRVDGGDYCFPLAPVTKMRELLREGGQSMK